MTNPKPLRLSETGLNFIKAHTDYYPEVRLSSEGVPLIGYSHAGREVKVADVGELRITEEKATEQLKADVKPLEHLVNLLVRVRLKQYQYDALIDYVWTVGVQRFHGSELLKVINAGQFLRASELMRTSTLAGRETEARLRSRREAEARLFNGKWKAADHAGKGVTDER